MLNTLTYTGHKIFRIFNLVFTNPACTQESYGIATGLPDSEGSPAAGAADLQCPPEHKTHKGTQNELRDLLINQAVVMFVIILVVNYFVINSFRTIS
jgi:hypothetical protein